MKTLAIYLSAPYIYICTVKFIGKKFPTVTSFIDYSHLHAVKILSIRLKTPHLTGEELSYSAVSTLKIAKVHLIDTITCIINQPSDSSSECKIRYPWKFKRILSKSYFGRSIKIWCHLCNTKLILIEDKNLLNNHMDSSHLWRIFSYMSMCDTKYSQDKKKFRWMIGD